MRLIDRIAVIPRRDLGDARGRFLKVLDGGEAGLPPRVGEVYLTTARPGQARGNHYHLTCDEWFTLMQGEARLLLGDPVSGELAELQLSAAVPQTVHVPAGIAHVFVNSAEAEIDFLLIAYAAERYDPADTIPHPLWP